MRSPERLSSRVAWSSSPVPGWRRIARWGPTILWGIAEILMSADGPGIADRLDGPHSADPRIPDDPHRALGSLVAEGMMPGPSILSAGKQVVTVYLDRATITPGIREIALPLDDLILESGKRLHPTWRRRKAVDARWEFHVTGAHADLHLRGSWLLLAQIGTLAGWDEPS